MYLLKLCSCMHQDFSLLFKPCTVFAHFRVALEFWKCVLLFCILLAKTIHAQNLFHLFLFMNFFNACDFYIFSFLIKSYLASSILFTTFIANIFFKQSKEKISLHNLVFGKFDEFNENPVLAEFWTIGHIEYFFSELVL